MKELNGYVAISERIKNSSITHQFILASTAIIIHKRKLYIFLKSLDKLKIKMLHLYIDIKKLYIW